MNRLLIIIGLTVLILTGCQKQDEVVVDTPTPEPEKDYVLADLALSIPASTAGTRMSDAVVQTTPSMFRGISKLSIIPFSTSGKVGRDDIPNYYSSGNTYQDLMAENASAEQRYFYYQKFYLSRMVSSFLIYGQAAQEDHASPKTYYGSLLTNVDGVKSSAFPNRLTETPASLSFELEPIYPYDNTTVPAEATLLADYLTWIADTKASDGSWSWKNYNANVTLHNLYESFINKDIGNTESDVYDVIAGSSANVRAYVEKLRADLNTLAPQYEIGTEDRSIIDAVTSRLASYSKELGGKQLTVTTDVNGRIYLGGNCTNYPANIGLPDGAAALQWTDLGNGTYAFVPQTEATTLTSISGINRYAYPAELYYYTNSTIKTSNEEVAPESYANKTWEQVLDMYSSGTAVSSNTKSVAIVETMQYAVAHLCAQVYATSGTLEDGNHQDVEVGTNNFPITGMIISGQDPVGFDFKPETAETGEDRELFVYDSYLKNSSGGDLYLTTTQSDAFHSLVLQTKERENISVILELRNDSQQTFKGISGYVYPGTKFYLAGKIVLPTTNITEDYQKRVFTQDYTTIVGMKVETLKGAYNVMPNIQAERLEISVKMDLKWIQTEPTSIELTEEGDGN